MMLEKSNLRKWINIPIKPTQLKQTTLKVVGTPIVSSSVKLKEETSQEVKQMDFLKAKASFFQNQALKEKYY